MSPFAGEGAYLAMQDGGALASAIAAHPHDTETAIAAHEADLFPRSAAAAAMCAANLEISFRPGAPQGLLDLIAEYGARGRSESPGPQR